MLHSDAMSTRRWFAGKVALAGVGVSALAFAALGISGCPRNCVCPTDAGVAEVPLPPAAQSSPITDVSADQPCTAVANAAGGVTIYSPSATTCGVRVQLADGELYTFSVTFHASTDSCCPGPYGFDATTPQPADADAATLGPTADAGCGATCATPAGAVQPLNDLPSVATAMAGRWKFCGNWPAGAPSDAVGIEFDAVSVSEVGADGGASAEAGNAYYLVNGPSGPERGAGFAYQLTYDFEQWISSVGVGTQVDVHPTPSSGFGGGIRYSPCPRELELDFVDASPVVLVPFAN